MNPVSEWIRARICKRFRRPEIDSTESIPPAYVAWAGRYDDPICRTLESIAGLHKRLQTRAQRARGTESKIVPIKERICQG